MVTETNHNPMRILVLIHEYPPVGGGGGRVAQDLCEGLAARGHEVRVLTAQCGDLSPSETRAGVQVIRLESRRREMFRADMKAMTGFVWVAIKAGRRMIKTWQPDVMHVHFAVPTGISALVLKQLTHLPYVLTAHLGDVPGGVPEKTAKWFRWIFPFTPPIWRGAAAVAAVSAFTRDLALKYYKVPIKVIHNGVDLDALDPGEIRLNTPPHIVFAGRFMPQKNLLTLVRCLAKVAHLPWLCTLIGDGPQRVAVETEISQLGLQDRINLPGWVTPEEVIETYRYSDILFMPSLSEGLPVVGVQAMAMGLALVMSRAGGNVDLVAEGQNGFLFKPQDVDGFVAALKALLENPRRLMAFRQGSRKHAADFDLKQITDQYEVMLAKAAKNQ